MASCNEGIDKYNGSWGPKGKGKQNLTSDTVKATGIGKAGSGNEDGKGRSKGGMESWTGKKDAGANKGKLFNPGTGGKDKGAPPKDIAPEQSKLEK